MIISCKNNSVVEEIAEDRSSFRVRFQLKSFDKKSETHSPIVIRCRVNAANRPTYESFPPRSVRLTVSFEQH